MYDLIVIGGGPAGSSAAIAAARAGAQVLLLERGRYPRHKVCGEFVSAESLDLLSTLLGTHDKVLLNEAIPISHTRLFVDDRVLEIPVTPAAASIARFDLDATLWHTAQNCGVEAHQQTMVRVDTASTLLDVFGQNLQLRERSGNWQPLTEPVTTSPLFFRPPRPVQGTVLMAGDAAGFVDPFVVDGISLALRSSALAAKSL